MENGRAVCCGTTARRRATSGRSSDAIGVAAELHPAGSGTQDPGDDPQQGRLARAVGARPAPPAPRARRERDVAQDRPAAGLDGDPVDPDRGAAHSSYPVRARRRSARKNGAPMTAVTTPTGTPPSSRATDVGARRAGSPRTAPRSAARAARSARRAAAPRAGTTRPTNPMSPATATPAAVTSDASASRITRSRRTSTPRCAAASSPSRNPLSARARSRISALPAEDERSCHREPAPGGAVEAAQQVREDLPQPGPGQVHRHREAGREQRAHGIAGEQQRGQRRQRRWSATACTRR